MAGEMRVTLPGTGSPPRWQTHELGARSPGPAAAPLLVLASPSLDRRAPTPGTIGASPAYSCQRLGQSPSAQRQRLGQSTPLSRRGSGLLGQPQLPFPAPPPGRLTRTWHALLRVLDWFAPRGGDRRFSGPEADIAEVAMLRSPHPPPRELQPLQLRRHVVLVARYRREEPPDIWRPLDAAALVRIWRAADPGKLGRVSYPQLRESLERDPALPQAGPALSELRRPLLVEAAWDAVVQRRDGWLGRADWPVVAHIAVRKGINALGATAVAHRRAFWGYGSVDSGPTPRAWWDERRLVEHHVEPLPGTTKCCYGLVATRQGWREDCWFYLCQHHGLLRHFCADPVHPLTRRERGAVEAAQWGYALLIAGLGASAADAAAERPPLSERCIGWLGYGIGCVALPSLAIDFLLCTAHLWSLGGGDPCGIGEPPAEDGRKEAERAVASWRVAAGLTLTLTVTAWLLGIYFSISRSPLCFPNAAAWRVLSWVAQVLVVLVVPFNPTVVGRQGQLRCFAIGWLGQWERERVEFERLESEARQRLSNTVPRMMDAGSTPATPHIYGTFV